MMNKETYERLYMDVTLFDAEDVITTSDEAYDPDEFEMTGTGYQRPHLPRRLICKKNSFLQNVACYVK